MSFFFVPLRPIWCAHMQIKMHNRCKKIFEHISNTWQEDIYFGQDIAQWLVPNESMAIYMDTRNNYCRLLHKEGEQDKQLNVLLELLSYLDYVEKNHLIYVVESESLPRNPYLFYQNATDCRPLQQSNTYDIGDDMILRIEEGEFYYIARKDDALKILSSSTDISFLYGKLCHFLFANIHGTTGLVSFIEHGYLSQQDYFSKKAIGISTTSIIIAICTLLLSPILSVWLNNKFGESTIKEIKCEKLWSSIDTVAQHVSMPIVIKETQIIHDTVFVEKPISKKNKDNN